MSDLPVAPEGWLAAGGATPRLLHIFSTFAIGGPQRRFAAIANYFGSDFRHLVWPLDGRMDARSLLTDAAATDVLTECYEKAGLLKNAFKARAVLQHLRPDLLITYNWGAIEWAAANFFPVVPHLHIEDGFGPEEAKGQIPRRVIFRRLVLNRHSTVVVPSLSLMKIAAEQWHLDSKRLIYVPNGIACRRFESGPDASLVATLKGNGPTIGTIATLRAEKSLGRLIEAFSIVRSDRPCRLVIVGDGPERASLEKAAADAKLSDDVTFTGNVSQPERIVGAFDIFAVSSETEQMPLSILEAMAAGLPVASTDVGDIRAIVAEENQPFIVPKSSQALASAIKSLLQDDGQRRRLGARNQLKVKAEFDDVKMFDTYGRLFRKREKSLFSADSRNS